jgi:uncharacterized protein (TIGR02231 family)
MRHFACLTAFALLAGPACAETITATSRVTAATIFPEGAEITREVTFMAPAGLHELRITDLPAATEPNLIRLSGSEGMTVGATTLRSDGLPPRDLALTPGQLTAKAAREAAEDALREAEAAIAAIEARAGAAEAQAAFLTGTRAEGPGLTPEALAALADTVGRGVLAAREAALAARAGLPAAERHRDEARAALDKARAAEAALDRGDPDYAALSVAVTLAGPGAQHLTVTHYIGGARWEPVYDLSLSRKGGPSLTIGRGVLVTQETGEDWSGVMLTLSTAQPSAQSEPSQLYPELRRLYDPQETARYGSDALAGAAPEAALEEAPVTEAVAAAPGMQGDVVVYHYPAPVDVASGVENLRLALDEITVTPEIEARAVPRHDRTAFVLARFTNPTPEILLPGQAFLMREGTLVGATWLTGIAPGAEAEIAFGAIEGLQLTRDMPRRTEGDRGLLSSSTEREEVAVMTVKNLTGESWPVRLLDLVPYSEQETLEISYSADPAPDEVDFEARRGILAWRFDIAPTEERSVTLSYRMRWPEGMQVE